MLGSEARDGQTDTQAGEEDVSPRIPAETLRSPQQQQSCRERTSQAQLTAQSKQAVLPDAQTSRATWSRDDPAEDSTRRETLRDTL